MLLNVIDYLFLVLRLWVGQDPIDGPLDLLRYGGSDRQVSTLWVEAILVGDVLDGDGAAVGSCVLKLALCDYHGFALGSYRLRRALLRNSNAVFGLKGIIVGSFGRNVLRLPHNLYWNVAGLLHSGRNGGD
jgi:hypothetical protein